MSTARPLDFDLICLSHLRWRFVFQRPQHLMTRCALERRCFYVEEPEWDAQGAPTMEVESFGNVLVAVPHLPPAMDENAAVEAQRRLIDELIARERIDQFVLWYYTPMAVPFTKHLKPAAVVFDCMDELSAFEGAPSSLLERETELFRLASVVFTGGHSLYEAKRLRHPRVYAFPSSVDVAHFSRAREATSPPFDQSEIAAPRLGFFGVLDERFDAALLAGVAAARPEWQFIMIGPVVKIDPASLPRTRNIHYLGPKAYHELAQYIAGWDVALLPFARNAATRYISPTKTLEYLAAGKAVVSTSIRDVVRPYGEQGLAWIADTVPAFVDACERAMASDPAVRIRQADAFLRQTSWDGTWTQMGRLVETAVLDGIDRERAERAIV